tara:strand:- start:1558 stop:2442 length:885 start_codon:yes stop_codon:yes gene_type:complete
MPVKPTNPVINRSHPLAQGLVAAWAFEDGGGSVLRDVSGRGHNGTLTNMDPATDWVTSRHGGTLDFDGSDDYVLTDITRGSWSEVTVSFWFNIPTWSGYGYKHVIAKGSAFSPKDFAVTFRLGTPQFSCYWNSGSVSPYGNYVPLVDFSTVAPAGEWNHIVVVLRGAVASSSWINGVKLGAAYANTLEALGSSSDALRIGGPTVVAHSYDDTFAGQLADIRLWDRALTDVEAVGLYADPWDLYKPGRPVIKYFCRGMGGDSAISTGLHAIEAGAIYGAPGLNSGLHTIDTGIAT